jgi:hypothetical protein
MGASCLRSKTLPSPLFPGHTLRIRAQRLEDKLEAVERNDECLSSSLRSPTSGFCQGTERQQDEEYHSAGSASELSIRERKDEVGRRSVMSMEETKDKDFTNGLFIVMPEI